jgi:hypothetical protein
MSFNLQLAGKCALVTGGSRGVGFVRKYSVRPPAEARIHDDVSLPAPFLGDRSPWTS